MPNMHFAGMANYLLYKSCIGNDRLLDLHVSSPNSRKRKSQETEEKRRSWAGNTARFAEAVIAWNRLVASV